MNTQTITARCCNNSPIYEIQYDSEYCITHLVCESCYDLPEYKKYVLKIKKILEEEPLK